MLYIVHINYTSFQFRNAETATNFAELARRTIMGDREEVSVDFVLEENDTQVEEDK